MTPEEIKQEVERLGPWHYNHLFPHDITTGSSQVEEVHPKLQQLLNAGAFSRAAYSNVLDMGANSGLISMWFVDHKRSIVDAIERGPKYFPQLEFAVKLKGYTDTINCLFMDICDLDPVFMPPSPGYDLVLFLGTLHHIKESERQNSIRKCHIALIPGGEVVVQTRSDFDVASMLKEAGFLEIQKLDTFWKDRSAWQAFKDPMKI